MPASHLPFPSVCSQSAAQGKQESGLSMATNFLSSQRGSASGNAGYVRTAKGNSVRPKPMKCFLTAGQAATRRPQDQCSNTVIKTRPTPSFPTFNRSQLTHCDSTVLASQQAFRVPPQVLASGCIRLCPPGAKRPYISSCHWLEGDA